MTEVELAKKLRKSKYTCEGVNCDECRKTNYIHECLMADVQLYCEDILGADDNYIEKLEKENEELKANYEKQKEINKELVDECEDLKVSREQFRIDNENCHKKIMELQDQIEKMKCCGNCFNSLYGNRGENGRCEDCGNNDQWELKK